MSEQQKPGVQADELYELLPAVYRSRDAGRGYPLKALLRVVQEQVEVVHENIDQLYENWFVETAEDWAVPYIGDLVGYQAVVESPETGTNTAGAALRRILAPRREVANTIRNRRRRGTLPMLELLGFDVAGWPARAVEFYRLLGWTQNLNHTHLDRGRSVDLHDVEALSRLEGPFDRLGHTVDVRRIVSRRREGHHNIPNVGLFVWRLKPYSVTGTAALCLEGTGPHCYTFSALGQDLPLHRRPQPQTRPTDIADVSNVPAPISRYDLERRTAEFYGADRSLAIYAGHWGGHDPEKPVPPEAVVVADLTDWLYLPPRNMIAVDPVRGRIAFPPGQLPRQKVHVDYHYVFSADIGGGEYDRPLAEPHGATVYRVGQHMPEGQGYRRIADAVSAWHGEKPTDAVIEITDSGVYIEQLAITLENGQHLQVRAVNRKRPLIHLIDMRPDLADALVVQMEGRSRLVLDGLLITGRAVHLRGPEPSEPGSQGGHEASDQAHGEDRHECGARVVIRHCTLVPGWGLNNDCAPRRQSEPSLELYNVRAALRLENSIVGSIQINEDAVNSEPVPVSVSDSIVDAADPRGEAVGAPGRPVAHAVLSVRRSTVFGIVQVHAMDLAENSIFMDCVHVARRQIGCMRFCYVPPDCRTPRRTHCQPDMAAAGLSGDRLQTAQRRARPKFNSIRYGMQDYGQLSNTCAEEIVTGADDRSEMGAFHDLFQPQRAATLRARLHQFVPAGMAADIVFVT